MLTHNNIAINAIEALMLYVDHSKDISLSFLPICLPYEMTGGFYGLFSHGCEIALAGSFSSVSADIILI